MSRRTCRARCPSSCNRRGIDRLITRPRFTGFARLAGRARLAPLDREIGRLAVPALGALVAEPLFLATDTALVGHLGAEPLAGLGIASTVLATAIGLLVFLAYATTPTV